MSQGANENGTTIRDDDYYRAILKGQTCACGQKKRVRDALCPYCYKALPKDLKYGLNYIIRYGFAEAYEESLKYLKEIGKIEATEE
jgi:hypothetical protein